MLKSEMAFSPKQNKLLAALPAGTEQRLFPCLELVALPLSEVVQEVGQSMRYVYFPTDAIVSLLQVVESGASAEIAVVGKEGVMGISVFMGGDSTPTRAVVQSAGHGCRPSRFKMSLPCIAAC